MSNWWAPNLAALLGLCTTAGFADAQVLAGPPDTTNAVDRYCAIVRALK